tara:strand:+ start:81 stop:380 length:300 start_codon:yes stop_codon:yes gene_type:complete
MSALQQQHMQMRDLGIDPEHMVERADYQRAINCMVIEIGHCIEQLMNLGQSQDEIETEVARVIQLKVGKRNDHPARITAPTEPRTRESCQYPEEQYNEE